MADTAGEVADRWPTALSALLDGSALEAKVGVTFQLVTVDSEGWPHIAMLSVGELLVPSPRELLVALWPGSRTTRNLESAGRALLTFTLEGAQWLARLAIQPIGDLEDDGTRRACFRGALVALRRDEVAYARLDTGIRYSLTDEGEVLTRWERTIDALRQQT